MLKTEQISSKRKDREDLEDWPEHLGKGLATRYETSIL